MTLTGHAAAKGSPFEDVRLAYRALLILRDHYMPMRREGGLEGGVGAGEGSASGAADVRGNEIWRVRRRLFRQAQGKK